MKTYKKEKTQPLPLQGSNPDILGHSVDAMLIMDPRSSLLLYVNAAAVKWFGYKSDRSLKRKAGLPRMIPEWTDAFRNKVARRIRQDGQYTGEHLFSIPGQRRLWANISIGNLPLEKQKGWLIHVCDISDIRKKSDELIESERKWGAVIRNLKESIVLIDRQCRILDISNPATGFAKEQVIGRYTYSFVPPQYVKLVKQKTAEVFKKAVTVSFETAVHDPYGEELWFESLLIPNVRQGRVINIVSVSRNVTEQKQAERARLQAEKTEAVNRELRGEIEERKKVEKDLDASRNFIESMVNSSPDAIIAMNAGREIIKFNTAAEKVFGYREREVTGKHISFLAGDDTVVDKIGKELAEKGHAVFEIAGKRKNDQLFPLQISTSLLIDKNGMRIGSVTIARDITEEKRKAEALRHSEKRYRELVENSQVLILSHNMEGIITSVNSSTQAWVGYASKDLVGRKIYEFIDVNYRSEFKDYIKMVKREGMAHGISRVITPKGNPVFWKYKSTLREGEHGTEVMAYIEDITEQVLAEKQIRESLREKEVLLREVHHRVKNNLQVISSILNLQSSYVEDDNTLNILRESQNRIKSMAFIHESLYQSKKLSIIHFGEYVGNLSDNLFRSYGIVDGSIEIRRQIGEVFLNLDIAIPCGLLIHELLSNSLKYAFPGKRKGKVDIIMRIRGKSALLIVEDNGIGLPADLDINRTKTLGLQLVVALVDQLGGKIKWNSSDGGSRFEVSFLHQLNGVNTK